MGNRIWFKKFTWDQKSSNFDNLGFYLDPSAYISIFELFFELFWYFYLEFNFETEDSEKLEILIKNSKKTPVKNYQTLSFFPEIFVFNKIFSFKILFFLIQMFKKR